MASRLSWEATRKEASRAAYSAAANITIIPNHMGLIATGNPENAFKAHCVSAREIKVLGLDMLYGPSLDVNTNPLNPEVGNRAFGDNPALAAKYGIQVIKAYAQEGIISNAKHFPGRGHGQADAHHTLESIDVDRKHLDNVELLPFRSAIDAGADSIMMAHTLYPALEKERIPASLSKNIIQGLLRDEMGFDGVVIPDTLTMFAISKNFSVPTAAAMCLEAGADMIFMKVRELYEPVVEAIRESIISGRLSEDRVNQSLMRILKLKNKHGLFEADQPSRRKISETLDRPDHKSTVRQIAREGIVVMRNREGALPVAPDPSLRVLGVVPRETAIVLSCDDEINHEMLLKSLRRYFPLSRQALIDKEPVGAAGLRDRGPSQEFRLDRLRNPGLGRIGFAARFAEYPRGNRGAGNRGNGRNALHNSQDSREGWGGRIGLPHEPGRLRCGGRCHRRKAGARRDHAREAAAGEPGRQLDVSTCAQLFYRIFISRDFINIETARIGPASGHRRGSRDRHALYALPTIEPWENL